VVFIETSVFTGLIKDALSDEDYGALQRGGIRIVYYWRARADQIYLLFLFANAKYVKELK